MIVVDSSVWIDHFDAAGTPHAELLARLILARDNVLVVGDLVLFEVLSGYRPGRIRDVVRSAMESFHRAPLAGFARVDVALERHHRLRTAGYTASLTDMLVGSFCLDEEHTLLSRDRIFAAMRDHLGLRLIDPATFESETC